MIKKIKLLVLFVVIIGGGLLHYNHTNKAVNLKIDKIYQKLDEKTENVSEIIDGEFIIQIDDKFGILDEESKKIKDVEYDLVIRLDKRLYFLKKNGKGILFNSENKKELEIEELAEIKKGLFKIGKNNKFGVINNNLENIMEMEYLYIGNNSQYIIGYKNEESSILTLDKLKKVDTNYDDGDIKLGIGKYFYIMKNGKLGILDDKGNVIKKPQYSNLLNLNDKDIVIGYKENKIYFINLSKEIEKEIDYENFGEESNEIIMVLKDGKIGYINDEGDQIVQLLYDGGFKSKKDKEFFQVKLKDKWLLLDMKGKPYKELEYDDIGEYEDGRILVLKGDHFGYIDKNGKLIIPLIYNYGENFKDGLAVVSNDEGTGVINSEGDIIIPLNNEEVIIEGDYIYIKKENKYGLFTKNGKEILEPKYDKLGKVDDKKIFFKKNFKAGYLKLKEMK